MLEVFRRELLPVAQKVQLSKQILHQKIHKILFCAHPRYFELRIIRNRVFLFELNELKGPKAAFRTRVEHVC